MGRSFVNKNEKPKEKHMKPFTILPVLLLMNVWIVDATAQTPDPTAAKLSSLKISWVDKGYSASLQSDNRGVVEAAITYVVRLKLASPESDFKRIKSQLDVLKESGETVSIRYKAYLAGVVFEHSEMFNSIDPARYEHAEELFGALSTRMQEAFLSYNE
jgi:hypothetical protein